MAGIPVVLFAALLLTLLSQRRLRDALIEAINNFRGGPPAGMHPSPADDSALLLRHPKRTKT